MGLTPQQRSLIRLRGQSILYALWSLEHGFLSWETLMPQYRPFNPRGTGVLIDEERLAFSSNMSLVSIKTGRQVFDVDLSPTKSKPRVPMIASHFTITVPDQRMGSNRTTDVLEHVLIITPAILEALEQHLADLGLHGYLTKYLKLESPAQFFRITDGIVRTGMDAIGQKNQLPELSFRALVESIGLFFLPAESNDEALLDAELFTLTNVFDKFIQNA